MELAHLALVVHRDQPGQKVTQVLPDLRVTPVNVDLPVQKAPVVFRDPLDPLVAELEEPRFPAPRDLGVLLDLQDQRASKVFRVSLDHRVLLDPLAP